MRSFKRYSSEGGGNEQGSAETLAKKIASAYAGKSDGEVWQEILKEAEQSKRAGTLTNEELDAFYTQFSLFLDGEKRETLKGVIERLKNI